MPGLGTLTVHTSTTGEGNARYVVRGPHLRGTLMVVPDATHDGPVLPDRVRVRFGDDSAAHASWSAIRPDEPRAYGVTVHGYTDPIDPATVSPDGYFLTSAVARYKDGSTRRIPDGARALVTAAVAAVVRHWQQCAERDLLVLAAARHHAASRAGHELLQVQRLEDELAVVRAERAAARRRIRQVAGLIRRRQPVVLPPAQAPVRLPLTDCDGRAVGVLSVRERQVNNPLGHVVYEVSGPRIRGMFTVGPGRHFGDVFPRGVTVFHGRPAGEGIAGRTGWEGPVVNGARLTGDWTHGPDTLDISPAAPAGLPVRTWTTSGRCGPARPATQRRAAAVLRALALLFLARPDLEALRTAVGKKHAPGRRVAIREELARLRRREASVTAALQHHLDRQEQFTALAATVGQQPGSATACPPAPGNAHRA